MKSYEQQQAVDKTQQIMEHWYCGDAKPLLTCLSENVSWIGAAAGQYFIGRAAVEQALQSAQEDIPLCEVSRQHYSVAASGAGFCLVTGRLTVTVENDDQFLRENQRVSFLWGNGEEIGQPVLIHIHVSNPAASIEKDETFPFRASKAAYLYIRRQIEKDEPVPMDIADGDQCRVDPALLIYLEAAREYVILHCNGKNLRVHKSFSAVRRMFPQLVQIHRSYCVNPDYILSFGAKELYLRTGEQLPLARSRRAELEAVLGG